MALRPRTIIVEGTSDVDLFELAARLELAETGDELLGTDLTVVAGGAQELGGATGVVRELIRLQSVSSIVLLPNGRPRYRFIGLLDNDSAGKRAVNTARSVDSSLLECKDLFRLRPVMPQPGDLDPGSVRRAFERENAPFNQLDWELEDLLPEDFIDAFLTDHPRTMMSSRSVEGETHREWTRDGKARLHRFVKEHALHSDLRRVIDVLKALRFYLRLQ